MLDTRQTMDLDTTLRACINNDYEYASGIEWAYDYKLKMEQDETEWQKALRVRTQTAGFTNPEKKV